MKVYRCDRCAAVYDKEGEVLLLSAQTRDWRDICPSCEASYLEWFKAGGNENRHLKGALSHE